MRYFLLALFAMTSTLSVFSQCEEGEIEVLINLYTDAWGNELYWELLPSGQACGDNPILFGGNSIDVGCDGSGQQDSQGGNGYNSNAVISLDPICLVEGEFYDLIFVDDWNDGGLTFEIFEDGSLSHVFTGAGSPSILTFEAGNAGLADHDSPCDAAPIDIDGDPVMLSSVNAIAQIGEVTPGGGNCGVNGVWCEGGVDNSVWGSFTVPDAGKYRITTCNEGTAPDTQVAVYSFDDCLDMSTYSLVAANDDTGCGIANYWSSTCFVTCQEPGTEFLVQIDGWYGSAGDVYVSVETWLEDDASLQAWASNIPCALDKGEESSAFLYSWVYGWGSDFTAEWTGPDGFESSDHAIYNLDPGVYNLTVTNPCGDESFEGEWEVFNPEPFAVSFDVNHPDCALSGNGSIVPTISGATPSYSTFWIGPDDFQSTDPTLSDLGEGLFTAFITDNNGCEFEQNITIEASNDFSFTIGVDTTLCLSESYLIYGPSDLTYTWQDGSDNQFFEVVGDLLGVGQFSFILNASTDDGCEHTDALIVTVEDCVNAIDEERFAEMNVYPIPSTGAMWIEGLPHIDKGVLSILDAKGSTVYRQELNGHIGTLALDLDLAPGLYSMSVSDMQATSVKRIVIE
jgi:hypothetical protein